MTMTCSTTQDAAENLLTKTICSHAHRHSMHTAWDLLLPHPIITLAARSIYLVMYAREIKQRRLRVVAKNMKDEKLRHLLDGKLRSCSFTARTWQILLNPIPHVINSCVCLIFVMNKFSGASKKWRFYAAALKVIAEEVFSGDKCPEVTKDTKIFTF